MLRVLAWEALLLWPIFVVAFAKKGITSPVARKAIVALAIATMAFAFSWRSKG